MKFKIQTFFLGGDQQNSISHNIGFLILRFFVGLAFCTVFEKFFPRNGIWGPQEWFIQDTASMGFPFPSFFAWIAVLSEFVGGILLMLGLFTRPAALLNVFVTFTATFVYHKGDIGGTGLLSFFFMIMCLCILLFGSGKYSLEYLMTKRLMKKILTLSTITLLFFSSTYAVAKVAIYPSPSKKELTNVIMDSTHIQFYLKNKNILPRKITFIIYKPQHEGNNTIVKWFLPYQKIQIDLPVGSKIYIATKLQIDKVMQGNRIDGDLPFIRVEEKIKDSIIPLN